MLDSSRDGPAAPLGAASSERMERWFFSSRRHVPRRAARDDARRLPALVVANVQPQSVVPYLAAARRLDLPVAAYVASWDHTVGKGVISPYCDRYVVQNEVMEDDLRRYHGIDPSRVVVTGWPQTDVFQRSAPALGVRRAPALLRARSRHARSCSSWATRRRTRPTRAASSSGSSRGGSDGPRDRFQLLFRPHPRDSGVAGALRVRAWRGRRPPCRSRASRISRSSPCCSSTPTRVVANAGTILLDALVERPSGRLRPLRRGRACRRVVGGEERRRQALRGARRLRRVLSRGELRRGGRGPRARARRARRARGRATARRARRRRGGRRARRGAGRRRDRGGRWDRRSKGLSPVRNGLTRAWHRLEAFSERPAADVGAPRDRARRVRARVARVSARGRTRPRDVRPRVVRASCADEVVLPQALLMRAPVTGVVAEALLSAGPARRRARDGRAVRALGAVLVAGGAEGRGRRPASHSRRSCSRTRATSSCSTVSRATRCTRRRSRSPHSSPRGSSSRARPGRAAAVGLALALLVLIRPVSQILVVLVPLLLLGRGAWRPRIGDARGARRRGSGSAAPLGGSQRGARRRLHGGPRCGSRPPALPRVRRRPDRLARERRGVPRARARRAGRSSPARAVSLVRHRSRHVLHGRQRAHARGPHRALRPHVGLGRRLRAPRTRRARGGPRASGRLRSRRGTRLLASALVAGLPPRRDDGTQPRVDSSAAVDAAPGADRGPADPVGERARGSSRRPTVASARCGRRRPSTRSSPTTPPTPPTSIA